MKILFLVRSLDVGGAEGQVVSLAIGLRQRGHATAVAVCYAGGPLERELRDAAVPVLPLEKRSRRDTTGFFGRLVRVARRERPDVLHGYLDLPNLLTVVLKPLLPQTKMVWGIRASNMDLSCYDWLTRLSFQLQRAASRFADLIIVNSAAGRDYHVARGFPAERMVVIPNGVDGVRFRPDPEAGRPVRGEWGVGDRQALIGLVARLDPVKGHPTFLRAAALLARERDDVRFVCVGSGPQPYRQALEATGRELGLSGRLIWSGPRSDMPGVYNALDIACSSSSSEGFPNVVVEAMASGVPCVVTAVGDSAWIVGDAGLVVPAGDPHALAQGWRTMLSRPREDRAALGVRARERVLAHFSRETLVEQTFEVLARLVPGSRRQHGLALAAGHGQPRR